MKALRPIYLEKCSLCGKEFDKMTMSEVFTGRVQYICRECENSGNKEMDARAGLARASRRAREEERKKRNK